MSDEYDMSYFVVSNDSDDSGNVSSASGEQSSGNSETDIHESGVTPSDIDGAFLSAEESE